MDITNVNQGNLRISADQQWSDTGTEGVSKQNQLPSGLRLRILHSQQRQRSGKKQLVRVLPHSAPKIIYLARPIVLEVVHGTVLNGVICQIIKRIRSQRQGRLPAIPPLKIPLQQIFLIILGQGGAHRLSQTFRYVCDLFLPPMDVGSIIISAL